MDPETKSRVSGVAKQGGGNANKNEKFVKTMKKLPDVKMGHLEGKNLTFSSDSEDPNFVSAMVTKFNFATIIHNSLNISYINNGL
jgi:hypothetical protein